MLSLGVQLAKSRANLPKNVLPLIRLLVGLIVGLVAYPFTDLVLTLRLRDGRLAGLFATGLFELAFNK
ncbi:holin [Paenibacillus sp. CMAA1364]